MLMLTIFVADRPDLWNVQEASIVVGRDLKANFRRAKLVLDDEESLWPLEKLSEVFPDPLLEKHLHIVVRVPPAGEREWLSAFTSVHDFPSYPAKSAVRTTTQYQLFRARRQGQSALYDRDCGKQDCQRPQESHQGRKDSCVRRRQRRFTPSLEGFLA